ncbi:HlyD family type I secretion periplasmic adaptor subunit [Thalassotalea euphylliae]|uniref:Membrane fusion protein (MFP) family protein n=1 Tax=Thalassotalea euphylliae TaxID=1655234 RepID=A0A3E0U6V3_9GAMM|nr:HlyD family type I secretion periplasmic adaptor subunit [Thalassotalea euphylliae]REL32510.1 HlyD family type I secretion periplasmic adaptor subunit [Thalassotalea euphylliae]
MANAFQAAKVTSVNTSIKQPMLLGLLIIIVFVVGSGLWAMTAPLASAIIASGQIKVDTNRKQIQHLDGGVVREVLVKDGQQVVNGDVMVLLDPVQAESSLAVVRSALFAARVQRARLQAERDGANAPDFSLVSTTQPSESKSAQDKQGLIAAQTSLFAIRREVQTSQQEILAQQIDNLLTQIDGYRAQKKATERQVTISSDELVNLRQLRSQGLVDNGRLLELERNLAQLEGERGEFISLIAGARSSIDEKKLELIRIKRSFNEEVLAELQEVEQQIIDLQEREIAAAHTLQQMVVKAPVTGTVVGLNVHTIGGVVVPGQLLLEIVPADDKLIIEGQVTPTDIDDVIVGQQARVKLSGFQQRTTPELQGRVKYVSADSMLDERSGVTFFLVRVSVSTDELKKLNELELIPGMPAEVFIQTGERTALEYLLQPLVDTIDRAWRES